MALSQWSTTAASNATITDGTYGNINMAEGMAPSAVNDSARSLMAHVRAWYEQGSWTPLGHTTVYVGATQFKVAGTDVSSYYPVGRRIRAVGSTTGTIYGRVSAVAFSTDTTVTVKWDGGGAGLSNETLTISVGFATATGQPTPGNFLNVVNTAKATAVASASSTDIWAVDGNLVHITGTTTITDFGTATAAGAWRVIIFDGALTLTHGASAIVLPGGANITTAANDMALVVADTTTKHLVAYFKADGTSTVAALLPRSYLAGLGLSNGTDATNDINFAAGQAADSTNAVTITLASALTKQLDASWAVGTNQGGLDTGSIANATYYVWLIKRSDTGVVDALFSTSATSPTMPTNYDYKRRIGSIIRSGATILAFTQSGDRFLYTTPVADVSSSTLSTARTSYTLTAPPSMVALIRAFAWHTSAGTGVVIQPPSETDAAPSGSASPGYSLYTESGSGGVAAEFEIQMNSSAQISARSTRSSTNFAVVTRGWIDRRGRDD